LVGRLVDWLVGWLVSFEMGCTQIRTKHIYVAGRENISEFSSPQFPWAISLRQASIVLYILILRHLFWTLCRFLIYLGHAGHQNRHSIFYGRW